MISSKTLILLTFVPLSFFSCESKNKHQEKDIKQEDAEAFKLQYNFENPIEKITLPSSLQEISGLSFYKNNQLACINDEEGKVFIFDFVKKEILQTIPFGKKGDYEGVEVIGNEVFILKSNGIIKSFKIGEAFEREIDCSDPDVIEYEGLGYDPKTGNLLLAAKQRVKDVDNKKMIYAYDFNRKVLFKSIAIPEEKLVGKDGKKMFRPSGIAVHPITQQVFIIASQGKKLLILSKDGAKEALVDLSPSLYKQPEGICFTPDGNLFISSEGDGGDGYILKFDYKK
ncbi:SdiA-regulated domain-containing protein [Arcicella sp. DC2W]|uniref:SdiA-regulated domain-containing protein n=1 Tax=Arcicella gelida TaxID=2984195 RepID=A0ABU5S5D6_9BACT|nr:SdiA-regulated domain-containing protein [Arcicella sp. DC2W]MEA5403708.1 SdiA-regulated domain-containing protein [Arcicella sp. DC2W]